MKILLVTPYYKDSFSQKLSMGSAVKQAEQLSSRHRVLVLTTGRRKRDEKVNTNLVVKSIDALLLPDPINYVISFNFFTFFVRNLKRFRPDVVMVSKFMFFTSLVVPIARILGYKVVLTTDTFPGINWFPKSKLVSGIMWVYARVVGLPILWMANKVILLYQDLEVVAKKHFINSVVISNGVDEKYFNKEVKPSNLKKNKNDFWVGFVGRPESVKGVDIFLKLAEKYESKAGIKFVMVGGKDAPYERGNILYLGFRNDVSAIYSLFDCLMMPSYAEGLPNVLMEAMAKVVPCIASEVGAIPSLIKDGKNGFLVNGTSVEKYSKQLKKIYVNKALGMRIGKEAQKTIKDKYNWKKIIKEYDRLFEMI